MQEKEFEVSQEELIEIIKRLSSEISLLRYELKETKEELKRVKRWVNSVSDYAIKKSVKGV
jgi:hypothetical protein